MPKMRRAVRTVHSFRVRMSGMAPSRDGASEPDLDGGDLGISQRPADADPSIDRHRQHDRNEQSCERRIDIVVEDHPMHFLERLGARLTYLDGHAPKSDSSECHVLVRECYSTPPPREPYDAHDSQASHALFTGESRCQNTRLYHLTIIVRL